MDPADKKVKLKLAHGTWQNLSGAGQVTNSILSSPSTIQENETAQVIIGSTSITPVQVPGILVHSDPNTAIILPKLPSPLLNIKNP